MGVVLVVAWHGRVSIVRLCRPSANQSSRGNLTEMEVVGHGVTNDENETDGVDDGYNCNKVLVSYFPSGRATP